jgi:hypothetical protein
MMQAMILPLLGNEPGSGRDGSWTGVDPPCLTVISAVQSDHPLRQRPSSYDSEGSQVNSSVHVLSSLGGACHASDSAKGFS